MKIISSNHRVNFFVLVGFTILFMTNCQKPPTPDFTYSPTENPEAGDTIRFNNTSLEADTYEWDFGNGNSSIVENPFTFFEESGDIDVTLTATNDAGSSSITHSIPINDPTVLGFYVTESDETTVLSDCEIWVYDNETDFNLFTEPQFFKLTDNDGVAMF